MDNIGTPAREALNNILCRTSRRKFDPAKKVPEEYTSLILHCAMAAPTAVNRQPWHFIVVESRETLDSLAADLPYCHAAKEAPLAIVVCADSRHFLDGDDSTIWIQDLSAASENILLAANALGLGAVWTAVHPHHDRESTVRQLLNIEPELIPFNVIPIGYSTDSHKPIDKWKPDKVTYIKH